MNKEYSLSVRELVEFLLRSGDINVSDQGRLSNERAVLGTRIHRRIEKSLEKEGYISEVALKYTKETEFFNFTVDGRTDAIYPDPGYPVIVEIKSTDVDLYRLNENYNELHWAQAKCYGYIYCLNNGFENCKIKLLYCNIENFHKKDFVRDYKFSELEDFFLDLMDRQIEFTKLIHFWLEERNSNLKELKFPYEYYRDGQRELAVSVYKNIKSQNKLFTEAPTGIGKTISTIFPSLKAMGEDRFDKLFYLTAKTTTRLLPKQTVDVLREKSGLKLKAAILYAKEKMCPNEEMICDPVNCKYAKGHYDRVNNAVYDLISLDKTYDIEIFKEYSEKHTVCPYEYALDVCLWSDLIICDYNYVFDPKVYLRRFFDDYNAERYVFLIDEAHNLVDRAREMFSISIDKRDFMELKSYMKEDFPEISALLSEVNKHFIEKGKKDSVEVLGKSYIFSQENDKELTELITDIVKVSGNFLDSFPKPDYHERYLKLYFNMMFYLKLSEYYNENFCNYYYKDGSDGVFKVLCLDPSERLKKGFDKAVSSILFSATLIPMKYYYNLLGGVDGDSTLKLASPFIPENRCVICAKDISSSFKKRELYYEKTADYIYKTFNAKKGNYIAFFPSYKYMITVHEIFKIKYPQIDTIIQTRGATDVEREAFVESFKDDETQERIGFCVLGGVFSEGIDLKGNRLIGTILVGVGIPQIGVDRELIKEYFDFRAKENYEPLHGFDYSYVFPGFTKILQSAGRVIRSEEDRGVIVLLDERYYSQKYMDLFPGEWNNVHFVEVTEIDNILEGFWND